jgi:T4-like virus tail tube protein gp19
MTDARADAVRAPLGNMRFRLEIEGLPGTGAVEVILPEARIAAGPRKTGAVQYGRLIVKRGLTLSRDWYDWWDAARRDRRPPRKTVRVMLLDAAGADAGGWLYRDAVPVAYQLSPLNALGNEPAIESLELSVGDFAADRGAPGSAEGRKSPPKRSTGKPGSRATKKNWGRPG